MNKKAMMKSSLTAVLLLIIFMSLFIVFKQEDTLSPSERDSINYYLRQLEVDVLD